VSAPFLVIAAGGTGGHMFPAQALAAEMLRRGWRVALSSDPRGLRYAGGFPAEVERRSLASATFARGGLAAKALAPFHIARGVLAARAWFGADRPACVAGFGGYPALPALSAAWSMGLPRLIHEQNGVLGRVNRLFAARVDAVACGTWPVAGAPAGASLAHVGNPVRDAVRRLAAEAPHAPPEPGGPFRLLAFGGSQGAAILARTIPAALAALPDELRARLRVTLQARPEDRAAAEAELKAAGVAAEVGPFFDDMPERLAAAHLVIARAGASTVAELSAMGRPAILVPYAAAMDDHQSANAAALSAAGGAEVVTEAALTPEGLAGDIARLSGDPARLAAMAAAARACGRPGAAAELADLVERISRRPSP
jgi:UDP-N-acetylglucosamine--N-acetylmuramyl-(pentapeptide) pyrophosphoryl-undecaprenol N-acetylglucosamine transferase